MKEKDSETHIPNGLTDEAKSSKLNVRKMPTMDEGSKDQEATPGAIPVLPESTPVAVPGAEKVEPAAFTIPVAPKAQILPEGPRPAEPGKSEKPTIRTSYRDTERAKMTWEVEAQRRGRPLTEEEKKYIELGISPMSGGSETDEERRNRLIEEEKQKLRDEDERTQARLIAMKQLAIDKLRERNPGRSNEEYERMFREELAEEEDRRREVEAREELSKDQEKVGIQRSEQRRKEESQRLASVTKTAYELFPEPSVETDADWYDDKLSPEENKKRQDEKKEKNKNERDEFIKTNTKVAKETRLSQDDLTETIKNIEGLGEKPDTTEFKKELIKLRRFTHTARSVVPEKDYKDYDDKLDLIDSLYKAGNTKEATAWMRWLGDKLKEYYSKAQKEGLTEDYARSFEDLAEMIMDQEADEWRMDGKFKLMERKTEKYIDEEDGQEKEKTVEIFHPENFLHWVRSRIYYLHDVVHTNDNADMLNEIAIPLTYRSISLSEIINIARYTRKRKTVVIGKVVKSADEKGKTIIAEPILGERKIDRRRGEERIDTEESVSKENSEYTNLKNQLFWEAWMFQNFHNLDAQYRLAMGQEDELVKVMSNAHYFNTLTQNKNRLLRVLKLPGVTFEGGKAKDNTLDDILKKGDDFDKVGEVGIAIRRSILAYFYIPDEVMFKKVMGEHGMEAFYKSLLDGLYGGKLREQEKERRMADKWAIESEVDKALKTEVTDVFGNADGKYKKEFLKIMAKEIGILKIEDGKEVEMSGYAKFKEDFEKAWNDKNERETFALKAFKYHNPSEDDINTSLAKFADPDPDKRRGYHEDGRIDWEEIDNLNINKTTGKVDYFLPDGRHKYFENLNVYSAVKNRESLFRVLRTGVKAGVAEEQGFTQDQKDANMDYVDGWAFSSTFFTGISANNDTIAIGFDKDVIRQSTKENQMRAIQGRGAHAYEEHISGVNKLGLNLWQYLKINEDGRAGFDKSLLELLQGGQGNTVDLSVAIKNFSFLGNAQRQFVIEHLNGFKLVKYLEGRGLDFDGWFSVDNHGDLIVDYDKANQFFRDGLWHDARYAFDQPEMLWNHKIRYWRRVQVYEDQNRKETLDSGGGKNKPIHGKRELVFMEGTIAEAMFDDQIRNMGMYERKEKNEIGSGDKRDKDTPRQPRAGAGIARDLVAWLIAQEFRRRRKWSTGQRRWSWYEVQLIKDYFTKHCPWRTIEVEVPLLKEGKKVPMLDEGGNPVFVDGKQQFVMINETRVVSHFFNDKEWEDSIADIGHAKREQLILEDMGYGMGGGMTAALQASSQALVKAIFQDIE